MNKQELIDELARHASCLEDFRGIIGHCDGKYEAYEIAIELAKQLDEPQKPVVPRFVADWIEYAKKKGDSLAISFKPWNLYGVEYSKADRWIEDNQETFARAWLYGYEVEKEPLYRVIMPNPQSKNGNVLVLRRTQQGTITVNKVKKITARLGEGMDLTEEEIKSVDERFWAFAVPVEEVAER